MDFMDQRKIGASVLEINNVNFLIELKEVKIFKKKGLQKQRSEKTYYPHILRYFSKMALYSNVTKEQQEAIDELRRRTINDVTPKMLDDENIFYRFSKARNFNLKEAETMLKKHIEWRKEYQMDTIVTDYNPPEVIRIYNTSSFVCFDIEGFLVRYVDYGNVDAIGLWNSLKKIDILKFILMEMEQDTQMMIQQSKKLGKPRMQGVYILNFKNLSFLTATHRKSIEFALFCLKAYQDNFPERLKFCFIINVSAYFYLAFSIMKTVIAASIHEKFKIYASDGWKADLLKLVDADELPAFLGGNKTDPDGDPLCKTFIQHGQKIPKSYYLCNTEKKLSTAADAKKITVTRFSKEEISFEVTEADSYLEWEFETKDRDIGFSLNFRRNDFEEPVALVPKQRIDTCYEPEKGLFKCDEIGI
ncbi:SEC14-like protein 2, partial [Nephila pilipes]